MYRAAIEHTHPLEDDLLRVGIDLLPKSLAQWEKNQHSFDRLDTENPEEDENGGLVAGAHARAWLMLARSHTTSRSRLLPLFDWALGQDACRSRKCSSSSPTAVRFSLTRR